ncbi:(2Fe-2S)-binding protein [Planomonospora venezuelensis]|nr:(2Fe-2S)-binding protein [Planomonospora venezuelensis]
MGDYFAVEAGPAGEGWRPVGELIQDADLLAARVAGAAGRLGTGERRVAASILFQGLAARFLSPPVGLLVLYGAAGGFDPQRVHWRPVPHGPLPLRLEEWPFLPVAQGDGAALLYRAIVAGFLEPLADTVGRIVPVAPAILWGNAASALAGSVQTLARHRPQHASAALSLGRELLAMGRLRGQGTFATRPFFTRRTCCLYYRVPGGGTCGDCVLRHRPVRGRNT